MVLGPSRTRSDLWGLLAQRLLLSVVFVTWMSAAWGVSASMLMARCERFHAFEAGIAEDLLPWYDDEGISEELMDRTIAERTLSNRVAGLPLCILGGKLYVINGEAQRLRNTWFWQSDNLLVYAYAIRRLVDRWGPSLPDVEFVVESSDVPSQDLGEQASGEGPSAGDGGEEGPAWGVWSRRHGRLPVMRHCKTASSPDITVPIFHFYTMDFDSKFLAAVDRLNRENPWDTRLPAAFAAGTAYHRAQNVPSTTRAWDGRWRGQQVEMVRSTFSDYLAADLNHPTINYTKSNVPLQLWAKYRMVMHVDGISCSSRLWQLLALGSVVLREQSGYSAFYDKLLSKFIHYVPFWSHRPREVVWAYNWVMSNDAAARVIASRGQLFAREYLNAEAVECFWALLLRQYARLQRFTPGQRAASARRARALREGAGKYSLMPIDQWLEMQEGTVETFKPTYIKDREAELNLLPRSPQT